MAAAAPALRLAAVSVDLDGLEHYCRIHGLPEGTLGERERGLVASAAVPRLLELLDAAGVPGTFFVIGGDLGDEGLARALRAAHRQGVELANHSFSHDYALTRRSDDAIAADVRAGGDALERLTGRRPEGFRAPGYTLSAPLVRALAAQGYLYDSSAFPAVPYYALKAAVMAGLASLGRPSRAILDSPRVLLAPRVPYWCDLAAPYRAGRAPLLELPISVSPHLRLPLIGALVTLAPERLTDGVLRSFDGDVFVGLELHAIDALDESDGALGALAARQRDLRVPVRTKLERLRRVIDRLCADREAVTLRDAARRLVATALRCS